MKFLIAIWYFAVSLAVAAIVGALVVIVARLIRVAMDTRRNRRRGELLLELLAAIEIDRTPPELIGKLRRHRRQAIDLLAELTVIIRGASQERLFAVAKEANLDVWLVSQLKAWSRHKRRVAAELLGRFEEPGAIAALQEALKDTDDDVKLTAALWLAERDQAPPTKILLSRLQAGTHEHSLLLRRLFELIVIKRPEDVLAVAVGLIGHPSLRPAAIDAIGISGRAELTGPLAAMAGDPERNVRASVLRALGTLGHPAAAEVIAVGLLDEDWQVRVRAIDAARRLQLFDFIPAVAKLLDDEAWWVRFRAAEALAALGENGSQALQKIASSGSDLARRTAAMMLAEQGIV
jgi:HEAT repeat protein